MWLRWLVALAVLAGLLPVGVGHAAEPLILDGRDPHTLLDPHPLNHQLFVQMNEPGQAFRLGPKRGRATALADVEIGTQQTLGAERQTRFHGWFAADTYAALRPFDGLEVNLNLLLVNPSASDGYRASSTLHPGFGLHAARDLFEIDHDPLRLDVLGIDLGWMTTGVGLLLESTPLEGVVAIARWRSLEARLLYGGRALWEDDDYQGVTLRALDGLAEVNLVNWQTSSGEGPEAHAYYATLSSRWPILPFLHLCHEFGVHVEDRPTVATLVRADALVRDEPGWALHLGYQFRYYEAGFGPRARLVAPTWPFSSLAQEDAYQNNPFEYLGISAAYDQWSHGLMGEGRLRLFRSLEPYLNLEVMQRYARADTVPRFVVYTADRFRAPGQRTLGYFEAGARWYPFRGLPHRGAFAVTNHAIDTGTSVTTPVAVRTYRGLFYNVTLEARL